MVLRVIKTPPCPLRVNEIFIIAPNRSELIFKSIFAIYVDVDENGKYRFYIIFILPELCRMCLLYPGKTFALRNGKGG